MSDREAGEFSVRIKALEKDVNEMAENLREINRTLAEAKGGWKTLMLVAGAAGAASALIVKIAPFLAGFK